jgi:hypothetical protein
MNADDVIAVAIATAGTVSIAAIAAFWNLLRQGGGLQLKTPAVPTEKQVEKAIAARQGAERGAPADESVPKIGSAA